MNLFIIGVQKSGTSALSEWFNRHPDVNHDISLKDVHFLSDRFNHVDRNNYPFLELYNKSLGHNNSLFICVNYWKDFQVLNKLINDKFALAIILRNPIDRTISAYNYFDKKGEIKNDLKDLCKKYKVSKHDPFHIFSGSFYSQYFQKYDSNILNSLKIVKYEKFLNEPNRILEFFCSILGVEYKKLKLKKVNISGRRNKFVFFLFKNKFSEFLNKEIITKVISFEFKKKLYFLIRDLYVTKNSKLEVDQETSKLLENIFKDELYWYNNLKDVFD